MFARFEVATRPELADPASHALLRRIELAHPSIRKKIRWGRLLDVYWLDLPYVREDLITGIREIFWDRVLQWLFTGNLIPSAAGKHGGIPDLMEAAPNRPGKFWALERHYRPGVTDNIGRTAMEAFDIVLGNPPAGSPAGRIASGGLFLLEGPELDEDSLAVLARDVFCNELVETWTIYPELELKKNDRFHPERVKRDLPKIFVTGSDRVDTHELQTLADADLEAMSKRQLWALTLEEMRAVRDYYARPVEIERRRSLGLGTPTDVELEVLAQTWSEHCKHKIFNAGIDYREKRVPGRAALDPITTRIPERIESLFKETISGTTDRLPKAWLLSVFEDNAGIVAFDEEDAICIKVETHNSPSALDPYGGALTGIVGVNRDILGCGLGAKPIFNTNVFCVASPDHSNPLPDRLLHPRRILEGVRRGVEHGGNKSGVPTVNGALVFDERFLGKPLIYCGTGGIMPRTSAGRLCQTKEVNPGDRICMVGGRIGKDGIHGATFSSLALDETSPVSAVQLGDPITQKRAGDFLLEARDKGLYRAITDNGAGGLSSSVGEMARLSGGASMDVGHAKLKYPGLLPYEMVVSESQERMTVAVPPGNLEAFLELAGRRGVEVSDLGEFTSTGRFEIFHQGKRVADLDLEFLHKGVPKLQLQAEWQGRPEIGRGVDRSFESDAAGVLLKLLGRPNIASKEWLIRQYDHEVQGTSVVKPLHTSGVGSAGASSGPNDAGVIKPKPGSEAGVAVGCGINPKLSDIDPYLMAQSAVDEAVRNVLCVGAEFGRPDSVLALVDNFCWPDPVSDPTKAAALVRACYGLQDAALALSAPLVSGKDSMKNDFRGKLAGKPVQISVPPTLLVTAVGRVPEISQCRTADFKFAGDVIYLLGGTRLGLVGSEYDSLHSVLPGTPRTGEPDWDEARRTYGWLGGAQGKEQGRLRSLHDVSEGGMAVAIAESCLARSLGVTLEIPPGREPWELCFGEGFHSFVGTVAEADTASVESEWMILGIPFHKVGLVTTQERFEVARDGRKLWSLDVRQLRAAWMKEGYWE